MKILAIETSCDETAVSALEAGSRNKEVRFRVLSSVVLSQIKIHEKYGGVFPAMAKREHSRNLFPVFREAIKQGFGISKSEFLISKQFPNSKISKLQKILEREPELLEQFLNEMSRLGNPGIDKIAVTYGPGLEPALWVGVNFAKALSLFWNIPVVPVNHMEGHFFSPFIRGKEFIIPVTPASGTNSQFPILALLVSGGHTELVLAKKWGQYRKIGETRDDAAGEAFDKAARMLGLPYPGGPEISRIAEKGAPGVYPLPRPMLNSPDFDFSFSGLKTAVLYTLKKIKKLTPKIKADIAREFEEAVSEVLVSKTIKAAKKYAVKAILLGGGVAANHRLRNNLTKSVASSLPGVKLLLPEPIATTDNALMIAVAGYFNRNKKIPPGKIKAEGNLSL